jgi:hypothetical protein
VALEWRIAAGFVAEVSLGCDVPVHPTRFVYFVGATRQVAVAPWPVRPLASVGVVVP